MLTWAAIPAAVVLLALSLADAATTPVHAQDGDVGHAQIAGPYQVDIVAVQVAPYSGDVNFTITVVDAQNGQPAPNTRLRIRTKNESDGSEGWALAFNTPQAPEVYRAAVKLESAGVWMVSVEISGPLGDVAVPGLTLEVRSESRSSYGGLVFAGVSLVFVAGTIYLWWSSRRALKKRGATHVH